MTPNQLTRLVSELEAKAQTDAAKVCVIQLSQTAAAETVLRTQDGLWLDFSVSDRLPNTDLSFMERQVGDG